MSKINATLFQVEGRWQSVSQPVVHPALSPGRLRIVRRPFEGFMKDPRQFSSASRGRKLIRECPICGYRGRFLSLEHGLRLDSRCPGCGSCERHRLQHLLFTEESEFSLDGKRILHFAPERHMLRLMHERLLGRTPVIHDCLRAHSVRGIVTSVERLKSATLPTVTSSRKPSQGRLLPRPFRIVPRSARECGGCPLAG